MRKIKDLLHCFLINGSSLIKDEKDQNVLDKIKAVIFLSDESVSIPVTFARGYRW